MARKNTFPTKLGIWYSRRRVDPTVQMKGGVSVNDDAGLEKVADVMGEKVLKFSPVLQDTNADSPNTEITSNGAKQQRKISVL